MHQLFLLSPSVDHFCKLVGSVPVWLSDQGTESGLARIEPIAVQDELEFTRECEVNDDEVPPTLIRTSLKPEISVPGSSRGLGPGSWVRGRGMGFGQ
eukprot:7739521-Pyramimonas_sp.AAC.1